MRPVLIAEQSHRHSAVGPKSPASSH